MGIQLYFTLKCNMKYGFHTDAFNQVEKDPSSSRESFLFHVKGGDTGRPVFHMYLPHAPSLPAPRRTQSINNDPDFQDTFHLVVT